MQQADAHQQIISNRMLKASDQLGVGWSCSQITAGAAAFRRPRQRAAAIISWPTGDDSAVVLAAHSTSPKVSDDGRMPAAPSGDHYFRSARLRARDARLGKLIDGQIPLLSDSYDWLAADAANRVHAQAELVLELHMPVWSPEAGVSRPR
jgi:hypothetical protein